MLFHTHNDVYNKEKKRKLQALVRKWENRNTSTLLVGVQNGSAAVKNRLAVPPKAMELLCAAEILLLVTEPKN